jgi:hypothetical protein
VTFIAGVYQGGDAHDKPGRDGAAIDDAISLRRRRFRAGESSAWFGVGVPSNTPAEIIDK